MSVTKSALIFFHNYLQGDIASMSKKESSERAILRMSL